MLYLRAHTLLYSVLLLVVFFTTLSSSTERSLSTQPHDTSTVPITIVVAHCKQSLDWLSITLDELHNSHPHYLIRDVIIYSKCGKAVEGYYSKSTTVIRLPNVGRCDHTYLHFIANMKLTDGVVLFLKDTRHVYWEFKTKNEEKKLNEGLAFTHSYAAMIEKALSPAQFCCRQYIDSTKTGIANAVITKILLSWFREEYNENLNLYALNSRDETPFANHTNMLAWTKQMDISFPRPLTSVCYGGVFAVSVNRLREIDQRTWQRLEVSLSRGNNIQEGHFMERTWSALLATDSFPYFRPKVRCFRKEVCGYFGNIVVKWKTLKSTYICQTKLHTFADMKYIGGCTVRKFNSSAQSMDVLGAPKKKNGKKSIQSDTVQGKGSS